MTPLNICEQDDADPNLGSILQRLQGHLTGLQENAIQAGELAEAVVNARAAVDDVLYSHTSPSHYADAISP